MVSVYVFVIVGLPDELALIDDDFGKSTYKKTDSSFLVLKMKTESWTNICKGYQIIESRNYEIDKSLQNSDKEPFVALVSLCGTNPLGGLNLAGAVELWRAESDSFDGKHGKNIYVIVRHYAFREHVNAFLYLELGLKAKEFYTRPFARIPLLTTKLFRSRSGQMFELWLKMIQLEMKELCGVQNVYHEFPKN